MDEFGILIGCLFKGLLLIASMPILIWILLYRKIKGKSNEFIIDWLWD